MLFPHRIMAYLFNETGLELPSGAIRRFWENAISGGETYASAESKHRIPIGFYGDAAQLITKVRFEKLLCFWMNIVIWRPQSIRYSRFLIWSCDIPHYSTRTERSTPYCVGWYGVSMPFIMAPTRFIVQGIAHWSLMRLIELVPG